jgi:NTP pyrophosphatase (non-canonical NTP hydrolase)
MSITIEEIQEWEKKFALSKGLPPQNKNEASEALHIGFLKLVEEIGELSDDILRKKYDGCMEELADVIIFTSKIGKILEDYYKQPLLSDVIKAKIKHSEKREFDEKEFKLKKHEEFNFTK